MGSKRVERIHPNKTERNEHKMGSQYQRAITLKKKKKSIDSKYMSDARETEMLRSGPYLQGSHNEHPK